MIQLKDSFKFAKAKIKTRKLRNLFSGCTISLGIIIILVVLMGTAGVLDLGKKAFKDSNEGRYFVVQNSYGEQGAPADYIQTDNTGRQTGIDLEKFKKENSKYNIKNVYLSRLFPSSYSFEGLKIQYPGMASNEQFGISLAASDTVFVKDYIANGYSFDDVYNGAIPVIMPKSFLVNTLTDKVSISSKENYELTQKVIDQYLGKRYTLNELTYEGDAKPVLINPAGPAVEAPKQKVNKLSTQIIIVGFSTGGGFLNSNSIVSYNIVIPNWAIDKDPDINTLSKRVPSITMITEFATKDDRNAFAKANPYTATPIFGLLEGFEEIITAIRKVALGIGGFFLFISALFILTTLGKIVADSKKEIGVFRAVGAQRADIKKIFFSYAFILTTLGFLMGLIISLIFNAILSRIWGDDLFYTVADMGSAPGLQQPLFVFIGIPALLIALLYLFILLVGLLASYLPARKASRIDPILALREG